MSEITDLRAGLTRGMAIKIEGQDSVCASLTVASFQNPAGNAVSVISKPNIVLYSLKALHELTNSHL